MKNIENFLKNCPSYHHWKRIGIKHHHGFCIPLFSVRSKNSSGIGEFSDLFKVIDFVKDVNMDIIQLLPINECGLDPSPYDAISSCALHPIYISLHNLDYLEELPDLKKRLENFKPFNELQRIAYLEVKDLKIKWLYDYFLKVFKNYENSQKYQKFLLNNPWLEEYALFRFLQDNSDTKKWFMWPEKYKNLTDKQYFALIKKYEEKLKFYYFLQFLAFSQMFQVKEYATKKGIFILSDIPILLNPNSHDVWRERKIFDLSHVAGCPPDDTSPVGQKWGFPLFNWEAIKKRNFDWWKRRLNLAASYSHLYRIDHAVGFFRIWAIKPHDESIHGRFLPKDPKVWEKHGKDLLLMMLDSSPLLPIAEDLGLIPKFVYKTLTELGICGIKVMRWQKKRGKIIDVKKYNPLSLTCASNHDFPTLKLWWENFTKEAKEFCKYKNWEYFEKFSNFYRFEILKDSHASSSLFHINLLQEYLAFDDNLIWPNPNDERINISGVENAQNWKYRYKPYIEDLLTNNTLKNKIRAVLQMPSASN